ncbi:TIGR04255 family protein [Pseudomonas sp. NBRC 111138]|uniref:TIGR04255 family protein n=1 Tax=Pseudomonas sp. NBRC 111138 TaxID=1661053 RepID=UPI0006D3DF78|nr:TIGR04255 family protein [Pseudomonas sp. NBRC 111138]
MAANIKPHGGKHAISNVLFLFEFSAPLPPHAFASLLEGTHLHDQLVEKLPRVSKQQQMMLNIPQGQGIEQFIGTPFSHPFAGAFGPAGPISGIAFDRVKPNGEPALSVNIQTNALIIVCGEYVRWAELWAEVEKYLSILTPWLGEIEFSALSLQYTDAFKVTFPRGEAQPLTELFSPGNKFLPPTFTSLTDAFHSHHGFFTRPEFGLGGKLLTNVNVNVTETASVFDVQITTIHKYQLFEMFNPVVGGLLNDQMNDVFQFLHDQNKLVVGDMLTDEVKAMISFNTVHPN